MLVPLLLHQVFHKQLIDLNFKNYRISSLEEASFLLDLRNIEPWNSDLPHEQASIESCFYLKLLLYRLAFLLLATNNQHVLNIFLLSWNCLFKQQF